MRKIRITIVIFSNLFLMFFLCTTALATDKMVDMQLLTPKTGWVVTETNLYWTINTGSTWRNITPQLDAFWHIAAVFFLDTSQGWVLCCNINDKHKNFSIAYTKDSGTTWTSNPIKLPKAILDIQNQQDSQLEDQENYQKREIFEGTGWIDFMDSFHGMIILEFYVSAKSDRSSGITLMTEDGGKTWKQIGGYLPTAGRFNFVTTKDGWVAGHINTDLYVTRDRGVSWEEVTLQPPPQVSANAQYDLPILKDNQNGFLPVTYVSGVLVLFATNDGGKSWKADRILADLKSIANVYPSTVVDSVLITLTASDTERSLTLIKVLPDGKTVATKAYAFAIKGDIHGLSLSKWWKLNFVTINQGWISTFDQLLSTNDGGETWSVITPQ